ELANPRFKKTGEWLGQKVRGIDKEHDLRRREFAQLVPAGLSRVKQLQSFALYHWRRICGKGRPERAIQFAGPDMRACSPTDAFDHFENAISMLSRQRARDQDWQIGRASCR